MPLADGARHPDVGEKIHFEPVRAAPFARLAAAPRDVEAESPRLEAPHLRFGQLREQVADQVEQFDVRGRVRAGRAADGRLVDVDRLVEMLEPGDACVRAGKSLPLVQIAVERFPQDVVDERTFSRTADAGDADKRLQRKRDVDVAQVVVPGAATILSDFLPRGRRCWGTAIDNSPERYFPVRLLGSLPQILRASLRRRSRRRARPGPGRNRRRGRRRASSLRRARRR